MKKFSKKASRRSSTKLQGTSSIITLGRGHQFHVGDRISITETDYRWWRRLWCWLLRKPCQRIRYYKLIKEVSSTELVIGGEHECNHQ